MISNRGSIWRKWDLHVHTPDTKKNSKGYESENKWDEFYKAISNSDVDVIGITDYFSVENFIKVRKEYHSKYPNKTKVFFPNIELNVDRTSNGKNDGFNIHIILDPDTTDEVLNDFVNNLKLDTKKEDDRNYKASEIVENQEINFTNAYTIIELLKSALNETFGSMKPYLIATVLHGHRSMQPPSKKGNKSEIAKNTEKEITDIFFGCDEKDFEFGIDKENKRGTGKAIPVITGSDAHSFNDIDTKLGKKFKNSNDGDRHTLPTWIKAYPSFNGLKQIIFEPEERISLTENNPYDDKQIFLVDSIEIKDSNNFEIEDQKIEFNRDLVSVIGGRGSGKSLLLSIIKHINGGGYNYDGSVTKSAQIDFNVLNKSLDYETYNLDIQENTHNGIPLLYIGQRELAEEAEDKDAVRQALLREIEIPDINSNYNSVISRTERLVENVNDYKLKLETIEDEYRETTKAQFTDFIKKIQDDIKSLNDRKDKLTTDKSKKLIDKLSTVITKGSKYSEWLKSNQINQLEESITATNEIIKKINKSTNDFDLDYKEIEEIDKSSFINTYDNNKVLIQNKREELVVQFQEIKTQLIESGIKEDPSALTKSVENIQTEINSLVKLKENYLEIQSNLKKSLSDLRLIFDKEKEDSVFKLILNAKKEISGAFSEFLESNKSAYFNAVFTDIDVQPFVKFDFENLMSDLNECLLKGHRPKSFRSEIFGDEYPTFEAYISWIAEGKAEAIVFEDKRIDQFKQGGRVRFLEIVFMEWFEYIKVLPNIIGHNNKTLDEMSIGEQATVLLKLKLATDGQANQIIIIDQPEDHLDNKFITSELTKLLRTVKQYKQIIIATHNANVVIGADSEQIIVASLDNSKSKKYKSGAIENEQIQEYIIDLLEGGRTALDKRYSRYN